MVFSDCTWEHPGLVLHSVAWRDCYAAAPMVRAGVCSSLTDQVLSGGDTEEMALFVAGRCEWGF